MTVEGVEERLREAIRARVSEVEPSPPSGSLTRIEERLEAARRTQRRRRLFAALATAAAVLIVAGLVATLLGGGGDGDGVRTADDRTTSTTASTSTTTTAPETTTSTTASTTTTSAGGGTTEGGTSTSDESPPPAAEVDASVPIWPRTHEDVRFEDPVDAARSFAVDFVGFSSPSVGSFQGGDADGQVVVRPAGGSGAATTVSVRRLEDGTWWVVGSAGADVALDSPGTGAAASCPMRVTGSALAFEGTVQVEVRDDYSTAPIGSGFVTAGGDVARPFDGTIDCSYAGLEGRLPYVTVLLTTASGEDGSIQQATARRVVANAG
jgi:hypothetical protein